MKRALYIYICFFYNPIMHCSFSVVCIKLQQWTTQQYIDVVDSLYASLKIIMEIISVIN